MIPLFDAEILARNFGSGANGRGTGLWKLFVHVIFETGPACGWRIKSTMGGLGAIGSPRCLPGICSTGGFGAMCCMGGLSWTNPCGPVCGNNRPEASRCIS